MKVVLLSHTPEPEQTIAAAARLCYSDVGVEELCSKISQESAEKSVQMLSDMGHESPVEHVSFTFGIEGVSRSFLAQITRHRIASYSVQSQRYVKQDNFVYITPPEIASKSPLREIYEESMQNAIDTYHKLADALEEKYIPQFLAEGKSERESKRLAEKKAIEDARYVLPNACETKMIVTMNVRSLRHFFALRCCNRAQWEIRAVANEMLRLCYEVAPTLFSKAGPPCCSGVCPEGKMSCGKAQEMRQMIEEVRRGKR